MRNECRTFICVSGKQGRNISSLKSENKLAKIIPKRPTNLCLRCSFVYLTLCICNNGSEGSWLHHKGGHAGDRGIKHFRNVGQFVPDARAVRAWLHFLFAGYKVSDTMRKGILEVSLYETAERELMMGCLASLGTCAPSKCLSVAPLTQHWTSLSRCSGQCYMAHGCHVLQASNFWHSQYCWRYCWLLVGQSWDRRPPLENARNHWYV